MAYVGGDSYQEGKASYRLGNALEGIGNSDLAITVSIAPSLSIQVTITSTFPLQYHKQHLERCKFHNDEAGVCKAYEALAKSYEKYDKWLQRK